jgi:hypothetical protein
MGGTLPMEWRGRINIMMYQVDLRSRVDDDELALIVDSILRRQRFGDDPEEFNGALVSALRSGLPLAEDDRQDEDVFRAALTGLVERFDALRPWPPEPFVLLDAERWEELGGAAVIGRVAKPVGDVAQAFRLWSRVGRDAGRVALGVRMLSGRRVALCDVRNRSAPLVELRSPGDPAAVRAEVAAATGLTIDPP